MKLSKKIVGLGLAVSIMISGLNAVPERVKASGVELRNKTKVIMSKTVYGKKAKKVKVSAKNKKAHLAYEKLLWKIDSNRYDYAKDCLKYVDNFLPTMILIKMESMNYVYALSNLVVHILI